MELDKAEKIAKQLMEKYCPEYTFKFDNAKRRFGRCNYTKKIISLSKAITELNTEEVVIDTILHEIAHTLTKGHNHDRVWRRKAIEIGCNGNRCYDDKQVKTIKGKHIYKCPVCSKGIYQHRKNRKQYACSECCKKYNNGKFSKEFILIYMGVRE